jgi:hypothetical protein
MCHLMPGVHAAPPGGSMEIPARSPLNQFIACACLLLHHLLQVPPPTWQRAPGLWRRGRALRSSPRAHLDNPRPLRLPAPTPAAAAQPVCGSCPHPAATQPAAAAWQQGPAGQRKCSSTRHPAWCPGCRFPAYAGWDLGRGLGNVSCRSSSHRMCCRCCCQRCPPLQRHKGLARVCARPWPAQHQQQQRRRRQANRQRAAAAVWQLGRGRV